MYKFQCITQTTKITAPPYSPQLTYNKFDQMPTHVRPVPYINLIDVEIL